MTIVPGMKRAVIIVGVLGAGLDLSSCTAFQEAVGTVKTPPDEFAVSTRTSPCRTSRSQFASSAAGRSRAQRTQWVQPVCGSDRSTW